MAYFANPPQCYKFLVDLAHLLLLLNIFIFLISARVLHPVAFSLQKNLLCHMGGDAPASGKNVLSSQWGERRWAETMIGSDIYKRVVYYGRLSYSQPVKLSEKSQI